GAGLDAAGLKVRVGALEATSVQVAAGGRALSAIAPPGAPGPADVIVLAGDGRKATLPAAFTFTAPPQVMQVSPASGSPAGGARVTIFGQGFGPGLSATIGGKA